MQPGTEASHHSAPELPNIRDIRAARERLGDLVVETPVWQARSGELGKAAGINGSVFFKLELFQQTGSFKPRGALTVMNQLSEEARARGVTAISAGNHAIAVGYAAKVLGVSAKVVMPKSANPARIERCRALGTEIVLVDDVHGAFKTVKRIEEEEGRFFVHPFEGPYTTLGTATLGLEWCNQVPQMDAVIVPIGGGGLCSGIAAAVKQLQPDCRVYGVEPVGADNMFRSFTAGKPQTIDRIHTIADSLAPPYSLPYSFAVCKALVDEVVLVEDDAMCAAMALLFDELKLAVEPAGAASTAALNGPLRQKLAGKKVGLIICGANIDIDSFHQQVRRGKSSSIA